jgi:hypothetical protein
VLAMSAHKKTLEERIADVIRLLASDKDGDIIAAAHALKRVLASAGTDIHGLAYGIENLGKAEKKAAEKAAEMLAQERRKVWDAAVQHTENRLHGADDFISADGKPTWQSVALYCQRNKRRLDAKHHDFIDKVAAQTVYGREPTEKMHKYLFSLFLRLGGRII